MMLRLSAAALAGLLAVPALADSLPPADGLPLSSIIAMLENDNRFGAITEVSWDDDGYWEIELIRASGRDDVEIDVDPYSGSILRQD